MGCFNPTRRLGEYAEKLSNVAPVTSHATATGLPFCEGHIEAVQQQIIDQYRRIQNSRLDDPTLSRFVRTQYDDQRLTDSEIASHLSTPSWGAMFNLSSIGIARIESSITIDAGIDYHGLNEKLSVSTLSPYAVANLAHAGNDLSLFDADELRRALLEMNTPTTDFEPFWIDALVSSISTPTQAVEGFPTPPPLANYCDVNCFEHDNDLYLQLRVDMPISLFVSIPGGESDEDILVRDTIISLIDSLTYTTMGLTQQDMTIHTPWMDDDIQACRNFMGCSSFTHTMLLEKIYQEADAEELESDFFLAIEGVGLEIASLHEFQCEKSWAKIISLLSDENHWINKDNGIVAGVSFQDNLVNLYRSAKMMVDSMKFNYQDKYPETIEAAEKTLQSIDFFIHRKSPLASPQCHDLFCQDDSEPIYNAVHAGLNVCGNDSFLISSFFEETSQSIYEQNMNYGMCGYMFYSPISYDGVISPDANLAREVIAELQACVDCLTFLSYATEKEIQQ